MGVVDTAKSYIGKVKYTWGADDLDNGKADCSSFTEKVFEKNGFSIGRTTDAQWKQGQKIDRDDLQSGDLVFFKNTYNSGYTDGVSHVGIYVGNNQFIHCSSSGGVIISDLNSNYYANHYLGARRVNGASTASSGDSSTVTMTASEKWDLQWWGDIVRVVVCILLVALAVVFFIQSFGIDTKIMKGI